jgi:hypothetical protein
MAENPGVYILIGAMAIIIIGHWFPSIKNMSMNKNMSLERKEKMNNTGFGLEQIQGIDLNSLRICKQNGLI